MSNPPYLDTSALAKWYLNEPKSEEFEAYILTQEASIISRLTIVEFRCLLARRRHSREVTRQLEADLFAALEGDIGRGFLSVQALEDSHAIAAVGLLERLTDHPLRSLDALHLAVAMDAECRCVATADRVLARAGVELGLEVRRFD